MFNDKQGNGTSKGELLLDDGLGTVDSANKWCYITFNMNRELSTIEFIDFSQNSAKGNCSLMRSYQLNKITLYSYDKFLDIQGNQMQSAIITLVSKAVFNMTLVDNDP